MTDRRRRRTCAAVVTTVAAAVAAALGPGCADSDDQPAAGLQTLMPNHAYSDTPIDAQLRGGPFRPAFTVDTQSGKTTLDLHAFGCSLLPAMPGAMPGQTTSGAHPTSKVAVTVAELKETTQLDLTLPANLPAGAYDLELRDPRGRVSLLKNGFRSLGPDLIGPDVALLQPLGGTYVVAETHVPVTVTADDGEGRVVSLSWTLLAGTQPPQEHPCLVPPDASRVLCDDGELVLPATSQLRLEMTLQIDATDEVGNHTVHKESLWLARAPVLTSFAPSAGPSTGMTQIVVRGSSFVPATRVLIDGTPITPNGGLVENDTTIRGFTVAHEPGEWPVVVETGNVQVMGTSFRYVAVPVVRRITPNEGPDTGGTKVTIVGSHFVCGSGQSTNGTQFSVGAGVVRVAVPISDCDGTNRVIAVMPPYSFAPDGTGAVSLFAVDPTSGETELPNAFTYTSTAVPPPPATP